MSIADQNNAPKRKWRFIYSVRTKYTLTLLAIVLIPLTLYTSIEILRFKKALSDSGYNTLKASANYNAANIQHFIERGLAQAATAAKLADLVSFLDSHTEANPSEHASIRAILASLKTGNRVFITSVALLDDNGKNLVDTDPTNEGRDESGEEYFRYPLLTGETEVTLVHKTESGIVGLFFSTPVYKASLPIGILRIRYSPQALNHALIPGSLLSGPSSIPMLVDKEGKIIGSGLVGQSVANRLPFSESDSVSTMEGTLLLQSEMGAPAVVSLPSNHSSEETWVYAMAEIGSVSWKLAYLMPHQDYMAPVRYQMRLALLTGLGVITIIIAFGLLSGYLMVAPLRRLQQAVSEISRGNLDSRVEITTRDEIAELGLAFNEMTERLSHREVALREAKIKAEASNEAKSQFLAVMSHEIRTPLNSVIGFGTLLAEGEELSENQRKDIDRILRASHSLLELINDILDFSKIEAGELRLNTKMVSLESILASTIDLALPQLSEKPVELLLDIADDVPLKIRSDEQRLGQILSNLLTNAVKFTDDGFVKLSILMNPQESNEIIFTVRDSGIGISEKIKDKLFHPFSQGDSSLTRKYGGTGLGLVICRRLARAMGGDVQLDSDAQRGTCVEVRLPTGSVSREKLDPTPTDLKLPAQILISGENSASVEHYASKLRTLGAHVDIATADGSSNDKVSYGLRLIDLDNRMPPEKLKTILRKWDKEHTGIPVIVLNNPCGVSPPINDISRSTAVASKPLLRSELAEAIIRAAGSTPKQNAPEAASQPNQEKAQRCSFKALVVEDDFLCAELSEALLAELGGHSHLAPDVGSAEALLAENNYDLILTDIHMAGKSGIDLLDYIQERCTPRPPVIVTTADVSDDARDQVFAKGADGLLHKPIDRSKFVALIQSQLKVCNIKQKT